MTKRLISLFESLSSQAQPSHLILQNTKIDHHTDLSLSHQNTPIIEKAPEICETEKIDIPQNALDVIQKSIGKKKIALSKIEIDVQALKGIVLHERFQDEESAITMVSMTRNELSGFPLEVDLNDCWKFVKIVTLSWNQLEEIPPPILNMKHLIRLNVSHNRISYVSNDIAGLKYLDEINLDFNQLKTLPESIADCESLLFISAEGNPDLVFPDSLLRSTKIGILYEWVHFEEILPGLYLGGENTEKEKGDQLQDLGVTDIISVMNNVRPGNPDDFTYHIWDIRDDDNADITPFLDPSISIIDECRERGDGVYVHCACGMSRSGSVVVSYLMEKENMSFEDALHFVRMRRPIVLPNPSFQKQIKAWYESKHSH
eukprot:TRINITY_DN8794_c0_g1_i2.p1 TRINITY_DN8794_c0_g1~~TRINITY_DN8794_c0_g1_i2.p1  ORF type:complete len:381 (+),score=76.21 TRINITY_DN8794_c0_g1_i2:27-1145(+)